MLSPSFRLPLLPFAELVPPDLPRVGLGEGGDELDGPGILVGSGHPFNLLLQVGHEQEISYKSVSPI